jgi:hypothetical protein
MSTPFLRFVLASLLLAAMAACSTLDSTWDYTAETLDPDPEIDLGANTMDDPDEEFLAEQVTPVDKQLLDLIRFLSAQDAHPDPEWFELVMMRYPWLDGVMTVDVEKKLLHQHPEASLKPLDPTPLYDFQGEWMEQDIHMHIDYTELGPEMYIATPMFSDTDWLGLLVVYFDPRVFFNFCPNPEDFIVLDPKGDIWTVEASADRMTLAEIPWPKILSDEVRGTVHIDGKSYTWLSRYIGNKQIIYAVRDKKENEGAWFSLFDDENIYVQADEKRKPAKRSYATFANAQQPEASKAEARAAKPAPKAAGEQESSFWSWLPWAEDPEQAAAAGEIPPEAMVVEGASRAPSTAGMDEELAAGREAAGKELAARQAEEEGSFWSWLPWAGGEDVAQAPAAVEASAAEAAKPATPAAAASTPERASAAASAKKQPAPTAAEHVPEEGAAQKAEPLPVERELSERPPKKAVPAAKAEAKAPAESTGAKASDEPSAVKAAKPAEAPAAAATTPSTADMDKQLAASRDAARGGRAASAEPEDPDDSGWFSWLPWFGEESPRPQPAGKTASKPEPGAAKTAASKTAKKPAGESAKTASLDKLRFQKIPEHVDEPREAEAPSKPEAAESKAPAAEKSGTKAASATAGQAAPASDSPEPKVDRYGEKTWFSWLPWFDEKPRPRHLEGAQVSHASQAGRDRTAPPSRPEEQQGHPPGGKDAEKESEETWFSWLPWFDDDPPVR